MKEAQAEKELTTADVAARLKRPERTVRLWCKQGLLVGARAVETPRGVYWTIPESALHGFTPPPLGRRPQPKAETTNRLNAAFRKATGGNAEKPATAKQSAGKGTATKRRGRKATR